MANQKVSIVVRVKADRKRKWVPYQPGMTGSFYLRYCQGSVPKYMHAGDCVEDARAMKHVLERRLKLGQPMSVEPELEVEAHDCEEVLQAYLRYLRSTRKRNGRPYVESSIRDRVPEIRAFLKFSGCEDVESITRETLLAFKGSLYAQGYSNDTVLNKLVTVTSWLRKNPVKSLIVLRPEDFPLKKVTKPNPYHRVEIEAMLKAAGKHKLLLRLFRATGMRKSEVSHLEKSDLNPLMNTIRVPAQTSFRGLDA